MTSIHQALYVALPLAMVAIALLLPEDMWLRPF